MPNHETHDHPNHDAMEHHHADHGGRTEQVGHTAHGGHGAHTGTAASPHAGHTAHADHAHGGHGDHARHFRDLFWWMLLLAVPVVALSPAFAMLVGYEVPTSGPLAWVPPVLGTVLYAWGGAPFLTGAVGEIRARRPGMMLLIGLAITVAFVASWAATLGLVGHTLEFWWELALLIVIMLLGHWLEMRSLAQTTSALDSLAALLPDRAEVVRGDGVETVDVADLVVGDVVLVRPGGSVPADGRIVDGEAELDESMITGESRTVRRAPGDTVTAGTVSTDSGLRVEVTATGEDTALAGIRRMVAEAQSSTSHAQRLADRAAALLFWFALASAALTAIVWTALGQPDQAVTRAVTVLVIACPHALGLAIPLVVAIATERAARAGVLVKDRLALERMRTVTVVVFDKTGTLTKGQPALVAVDPVPGSSASADDVLALAASAEADSEHPLARAIVRAAEERGLRTVRATSFRSEPALGVVADVDGAEVRVGGPRLLAERGLADQPASVAGTRLHVVVDGRVMGALTLADELRPESTEAVDGLHRLGLKVAMITGDARTVAEEVGTRLGVDTVLAEVRPEEKASRIAELQAAGERVAMVGDGVNDAPALAQADVGLAIGAGTDVAIASAGVILAGNDPRAVLGVITLSKASYRKMVQNLWWAAGYNLVAVPLAAGVLAPIGVSLPMEVGALLMSASTIVVAANAQWLRRLDLRPGLVAEPSGREHATGAA
ncbi:MAG: cadmium-translocating P-type ATPase [Actinobacteria bacterium]|nr:cadmium-translocating P-type ATPase [Actinomycetota bacterium]